jgi:hypothetical protein
LDYTIPNQVKVNNSNQDYNIGGNYGFGTFTQSGLNQIPLVEFSNYFKHVDSGQSLTLTGDLTIRIDDSVVKWKRGQKFRLSFGDRIYPEVYNVNILTDASGAYPLLNPSGSSYSKLVVGLDSEFFSGYDYLPVIEIVCIDDSNLSFQVDAVGKSLTNNTNQI